MIKIPFKVSVTSEKETNIDWESMGIEKPETETTYKTLVGYINPKSIIAVEPIADEDGSFVYMSPDVAWKTPLEPKEVVKLIEKELG